MSFDVLELVASDIPNTLPETIEDWTALLHDIF
jgi:hypothetical protein